MLTSNEVQNLIKDKLIRYYATIPENASKEQMYKAVGLVVRDILLQKKQDNNKKIQEEKLKKVYYLCMEFLMGRSLRNNLFNLELVEPFEQSLKNMKFNLSELYELEADPGLGNGGLGRLASCFMDSLATLNYPAMGFSIRYEYGLFKQKIVENQQIELPDLWLDTGDVWMMPRSDKHFKINLGGKIEESFDENGNFVINHKNANVIEAIPYDVMVSGYGKDAGVSVLRLWRATAALQFDMQSFSQGDYMMAMREDNEAELISKVLYPSDDHSQGKQLRLSQEYFLVSASLQSILKDHLKFYPSLDNLAEKVAIHANDTHPALAVPELMRLLVDEHGFSWEKAWDITTKTIAYTNHTVMAEALEKWDEGLFRLRLPRIYSIIKEINRRFVEEAYGLGASQEQVGRMSIIGNNEVRMANLSIVGGHKVNGVSALHSDIIKKSVFKDFYGIYPSHFTNVTNGIAHRRWLNQSNPRLAGLIDQLIGADYTTKPENLSNLLNYTSDKTVLNKLAKIKHDNKVDFSKFILDTTGFKLNPESRFDVQIKRLHEYKRQLLNALKIIHLYLDLLDNPDKDVTPQTFVFGAKAAGGYQHAKRIISLINCISAEIQKNPKIKSKLDVMFLENYNVSKAERLIPASEVSEQISLAGKEASGTGNMKFMMNGAITLGTVDGANVEILEYVGNDNIFTFGLKTEEVDRAWHAGYSASHIYTHNEGIKRIVDRLKVGFDGHSFADIANYLTIGTYQIADPYMCLLDFEDYLRAGRDMEAAYANKDHWNKMALVNIAKSGAFAADRSIEEYAKNIWNLKKVQPGNADTKLSKPSAKPAAKKPAEKK